MMIMPPYAGTIDIARAIHPGLRQHYQTTDQGEIIWFAHPPLDNRTPQTGVPVGHSTAYLARLPAVKTAQEAIMRTRAAEEEERKRKREQEDQEELKTAKKLVVDGLGQITKVTLNEPQPPEA
jgi:hypothetical protein